MAEFASEVPDQISAIQPESISRANTKWRGTAFLVAGAIATTGAYSTHENRIDQIASDLKGPYITERTLQIEQEFVHNGLIGIEPSTYLNGLLDLKRYNPETGAWEVYNVIVPNVVAHDIDGSAELFGTTTDTKQFINENGDREFVIQYAKMEGVSLIDGVLNFGNDAHFKVTGVIPKGETEMTMHIVPNADSAPIESAALGNFFGDATDVDTLETSSGTRINAASYPVPDDGNFIAGDMYQVPVPPEGDVHFWNSKNPYFMQWQHYTNASAVEVEVRARPWRPEFGPGEEEAGPEDNFIETVRVWQPLDQPEKPSWTFGYSTNT